MGTAPSILTVLRDSFTLTNSLYVRRSVYSCVAFSLNVPLIIDFVSFFLQKLFRRHGFSDKSGLVASYKEIAEFLAMMTYAKDQHDSTELTDIQRPRPLSSWDAETWMAAHDAIIFIHDHLLRHDANFTLEQLENEDHDDQQNFELANENAFGIGFEKLLKYYLFHSFFSPFRKILESSIEENMGKKRLSRPLVVSEEFLMEYR
jgi:hypothetical protein